MNIVPGELLDEIDVDVRALWPGERRPRMTDVSGMTSAATVTLVCELYPDTARLWSSSKLACPRHTPACTSETESTVPSITKNAHAACPSPLWPGPTRGQPAHVARDNVAGQRRASSHTPTSRSKTTRHGRTLATSQLPTVAQTIETAHFNYGTMTRAWAVADDASTVVASAERSSCPTPHALAPTRAFHSHHGVVVQVLERFHSRHHPPRRLPRTLVRARSAPLERVRRSTGGNRRSSRHITTKSRRVLDAFMGDGELTSHSTQLCIWADLCAPPDAEH